MLYWSISKSIHKNLEKFPNNDWQIYKYWWELWSIVISSYTSEVFCSLFLLLNVLVLFPKSGTSLGRTQVRKIQFDHRIVLFTIYWKGWRRLDTSRLHLLQLVRLSLLFFPELEFLWNLRLHLLIIRWAVNKANNNQSISPNK